MPYAIRTAREADVPDIVAMELASERVSSSGAERLAIAVAAAVSNPLRLVLVAESEEVSVANESSGVVGWAKTHHWDYSDGPAPAGHYLGGITVLPRCRRQGVASLLTEARLAWIWRLSDAAWYVVNARNNASLSLHQQWGFREIARRPSFHTVTFEGGEGILLKAERPEA